MSTSRPEQAPLIEQWRDLVTPESLHLLRSLTTPDYQRRLNAAIDRIFEASKPPTQETP